MRVVLTDLSVIGRLASSPVSTRLPRTHCDLNQPKTKL